MTQYLDISYDKGMMRRDALACGACPAGQERFDWLSDIPESDFSGQADKYVEIAFDNGLRKDFYLLNDSLSVYVGDKVAVESSSVGYDIGRVLLKGYLAYQQIRRKRFKIDLITKKILRLASKEELDLLESCKAKEKEWLKESRILAQQLALDMRISKVEIQADGKKATFFYTAEERVDFRELIRHYAQMFRVKIEMRHISTRQEAAKLGGLGSCGRVLCCSAWMSELKSVNINAARYQGLGLNKNKLSGQCGRLKCCLNFELDFYLEALEQFPKRCEEIKTNKGIGKLLKKDIFHATLTYSFEDSDVGIQVLDIETVKEMVAQNRQGKTAELPVVQPLSPFQTRIKQESGFNNVGAIALKQLDRRRKQKK